MRGRWKIFLLGLVPFVATLRAQQVTPPDPYDGIWEGYEGEWRYVSNLLLSLAEVIPAEKYSWRPAPGVRSVSEVLVHMESGDLEKTLVSKPEVIAALKSSLQAVKNDHAQLKVSDLNRNVHIHGKTVPVEGMYLRIICHDNEHLGQLIAYASLNGVKSPWSQ